MKQYSVALKRVWFYGQKTERTVFRWGEGEVCAFLMDLSALGGSENLMKQSLAVIAMVFEAMGAARRRVACFHKIDVYLI